MKQLTVEEEPAAMHEWFITHESVWSSQLPRTEAVQAAERFGVSHDDVEIALDCVPLILVSVATFYTASHFMPHSLRSSDALHLATP